MTRTLVVSPSARDDLSGIISYIELRNAPAAERVLANFKREFWKLLQAPQLGHSRNDVEYPRLRFWRLYSYMIAYRYNEETVEIVRIIHGHRDFTSVIGDSGKD